MSTVGSASLAGSNLAGLLAANTPSSSSTDQASSDATNTATSDSRGPATDVNLSDKVKAVLAEAKTNQSVAERLQAYVQSRRADNGDGAQADAGSKTDIDKAFQQLTGGDAQAADGTQTPSQVPSPVEPAINFSDQAQIGGFSVTVTADAKTGAFTTVINGPGGLSFSDQRFGRSDEVSGFQGLGPDQTASEYQAGNVEYITFTQDDAAAVSVAASSGSESVAASAAAAHSYTATFAIDFITGSIQATQSDITTASVTARVSQGNSSLSVVA
jgi:hypothetical protein